jgi:hypothetical protein
MIDRTKAALHPPVQSLPLFDDPWLHLEFSVRRQLFLDDAWRLTAIQPAPQLVPQRLDDRRERPVIYHNDMDQIKAFQAEGHCRPGDYVLAFMIKGHDDARRSISATFIMP